MRTVLRDIEAATRAYATSPFFEFLRDDTWTAHERLAFVPCMAPFILDFGDLNAHVLRDETSSDPQQTLVNSHTREDDHHWPWYLEDLATLGHDHVRPTSDVLRSMYSDRTVVSRLLASRLSHLLWDATPTERLAVVEAIEATGNVLFTLTAELARALERDDGVTLRYLGDFHLALESGHSMDGDDHRTLSAIVLDDAGRARCRRLVERVFELFAAWVGELHRYALDELRPAAAA